MRHGSGRSIIRRLFLLVVGLLAVVVGVGATTQDAGSAIAGRVVDGKTGAPVAGATVVASTPEGNVSQRTGPAGEFAFGFPKPVRVRLSAEKATYLRGLIGTLGPTDSNSESSAVELARGARVQGVVVKLWPAAVIAGEIRNGSEPAVRATVRVLKRAYRGGDLCLASGSPEVWAFRRSRILSNPQPRAWGLHRGNPRSGTVRGLGGTAGHVCTRHPQPICGIHHYSGCRNRGDRQYSARYE